MTDAVGDSVLKALGELKMKGIENAYSGTRYEFHSKGESGSAEKSVEEFSRKELLNTLKTSRRVNHEGEVNPIAVQIAGTDAAMMAARVRLARAPFNAEPAAVTHSQAVPPPAS